MTPSSIMEVSPSPVQDSRKQLSIIRENYEKSSIDGPSDNDSTLMNNDIFKSIKNKYLRDSQQYDNLGAMLKQSQPSNSLFNGG